MLRPAVLAIAVTLFLLPGCKSGDAVPEQTITVACGMCIWGMTNTEGCEWAAELDGAHYLVRGPVPHDHVNHAPDGMCNMKRQAVVAGSIRGDLFVASKFDLLPASGAPDAPKYSDQDIH